MDVSGYWTIDGTLATTKLCFLIMVRMKHINLKTKTMTIEWKSWVVDRLAMNYGLEVNVPLKD
ncbi:hypothetical protein [Candidatus Hodgkinia cicadicola]|uniref:hypothetical protein n=1 Tax=Candidatus Hodgkinia cicadicola TaxID=573658 RepID=UPI0024153FDB